jgi:hypothetical protein
MIRSPVEGPWEQWKGNLTDMVTITQALSPRIALSAQQRAQARR